MDRRTRYTRMVLNESLIRFLEQKDIARITVTELCADADINRSTYYAHYTDPYDQLARLKEDLLTEMTANARALDTRSLSPVERSRQVLGCILGFLEQRRHIFRILLTRSGDHRLQHSILSILGTVAFPLSADMDAGERNLLLLYAVNGCFGVVFDWLIDEQAISAQQLADHLADLTMAILGAHLRAAEDAEKG